MLIDKYDKYIYYVINLYKKKYYFFGNEDVDLYNEALILLYECIFSYREDLNTKFSSFYLTCLKRKYLFMIRTLTNNKNRCHAIALSLDNCYNRDLDLYNIIDNSEISISEQINNNYLIEETINTMKNIMNDLENKIIYFYLNGYTYVQIAKGLQVTTKKIDNTIQKYKRIVKISK